MTERARSLAFPGTGAGSVPGAVLLDTQGLASAECRSAWNAALDTHFCAMDAVWPSKSDQFGGALVGVQLGGLGVTTVTADAHEAIRTPSMTGNPDEDHFFVSVLTQGSGEISQDDRLAHLSAGAFALVDGTRPFHFRFDGPFQQIIVRIPRAALATRVPETVLEQVTAAAVNAQGGGGAVVSAVLRQLTTNGATVSENLGAPLSYSALDMLAAVLQDQVTPTSRTGRLHQAHLRRAQDFMIENLHDQQLSLGRVSAALGFSPRYLSLLFRELETTPQRWLVRRRIERAERLLSSDSGGTSAEVAASVGFKDVGHFSRVFRDQLGHSPGTFRRRLRTDAAAASLQSSEAADPSGR